MSVQREQLEADVLIVGAGPAGLSCALHLANLIAKHNASGAKPELSPENVYVLEKGRELGAAPAFGRHPGPARPARTGPGFREVGPGRYARDERRGLFPRQIVARGGSRSRRRRSRTAAI